MKIRKKNNNILTDKQISQITAKLNKEFTNVIYFDYNLKCHCFNKDFVTTSQKKISELHHKHYIDTYELLQLSFIKLTSNCSFLRNISKNELYYSLRCFGLIKTDCENYFEI